MNRGRSNDLIAVSVPRAGGFADVFMLTIFCVTLYCMGMAYKYRNVRITAGVISPFPANDVVISGAGIAAGYKQYMERVEGEGWGSISGSFRNNTAITLLCLLDRYGHEDGSGWRNRIALDDGRPVEGSLSLAPGASFGYKIWDTNNGTTYRLMFGHTDHPLVNIAGGQWNGYLYEVV